MIHSRESARIERFRYLAAMLGFSKVARAGVSAMCALVLCLVALSASESHAKPLPGELAAKDRAILLTPTSPWQLDISADRCRLARQFEAEEGRGLVLIEQLAPGDRFDLTLAGPDFAQAMLGSWFYGGMRSDVEMKTISPIEYGIEGYDNAVTIGDATIASATGRRNEKNKPIRPEVDPEAARQVDRIVLQRSTVIVSFETGNMGEAFEALNTCSRELLSLWELDEKAHEAYHPPRMPGERVYFSRLNHELATLPENVGHKSLLRVRVMVAKDGSVTSCHYEYRISTGGKEPDVCADIRELEFQPATTHQGEAIDSFFSRTIYLSSYDPWSHRW